MQIIKQTINGMDFITRRLDKREMSIRASDDGLGKIFEGMAIVFNSRSEPLWTTGEGREVREVIDPKALDEVLAQSGLDVRMLFDHDTGKPLGRTISGTLSLIKTDAGVRCRAVLPDTTYSNDMVKLLNRGDLSGMSFGFDEDTDKTEYEFDEATNCVIRRVCGIKHLYEVSCVTFPAYPATSASLSRMKEDYEKRCHFQAAKSGANSLLSLAKRRLEVSKNYQKTWNI